jgi:hypothetical protein
VLVRGETRAHASKRKVSPVSRGSIPRNRSQHGSAGTGGRDPARGVAVQSPSKGERPAQASCTVWTSVERRAIRRLGHTSSTTARPAVPLGAASSPCQLAPCTYSRKPSRSSSTSTPATAYATSRPACLTPTSAAAAALPSALTTLSLPPALTSSSAFTYTALPSSNLATSTVVLPSIHQPLALTSLHPTPSDNFIA